MRKSFKEYQHEWYLKNRKRLIAKQKKKVDENRELQNKYAREWARRKKLNETRG